MNVILYTTHCPRCNVLRRKLAMADIPCEIIDDENLMISKGFMTAPMLEVDGKVMDFKNAIDWINKKQE